MASTSSTSRSGVRYHQYSDLVSYVVEHLGLHLKGKGDASCADESIACAFSRMRCCDDNRQVVLLCRLPLARAGLGFPTVTRSLKCRKCTIPDLTAIQPNFKAEEVQRHWIVRLQESDCTDVQNINMKFQLHLIEEHPGTLLQDHRWEQRPMNSSLRDRPTFHFIHQKKEFLAFKSNIFGLRKVQSMEYHGAPLSCIITGPLVFVASLPNAFNQPSIAELSTNRFSRQMSILAKANYGACSE